MIENTKPNQAYEFGLTKQWLLPSGTVNSPANLPHTNTALGSNPIPGS